MPHGAYFEDSKVYKDVLTPNCLRTVRRAQEYIDTAYLKTLKRASMC